MLLSYKIELIPSPDNNLICSRKQSSANNRPILGQLKCSLISSSTESNPSLLTNAGQVSIEKIRKRLFNGKIEISPSAYDTAWVAMVPDTGGSRPCFPQCLDWIIENQKADGSWGLQYPGPGHPSLVKDSLACTLACLLALRKWDVAHQLVQKGLDFIGSNCWALSNDKNQYSPIGFEMVFPQMISCGYDLGLTLPLDSNLVDSMLRERDSIIMRNGKLGYVAEGLGESCNWKKLLMAEQRSNGSLFNSPATTAAALIHCPDQKCLEYLHSLLKIYNTWVPTIYPMDIYTRLCIVDNMERLGIDRYFQYELDSILDETHRLWQQREDQIFEDISCRAMAFRLLRMNGYNVLSDELAAFVDQEHFFSSVSAQFTGVTTILELYKASQLQMHEDEAVLEKIHSWTGKYLKQQLLNQTILDKRLQKQVEGDLKNFRGTSNIIEKKLWIELYDVNHFQILKTAYRCPTIYNEDILEFSRKDFSICQAQYQKELQLLERWYSDCKMDGMTFGRNILHVSYFLSALIVTDPQLSDARFCYTKSLVLFTRIDDYMDHYSSMDEARDFVELIRNWRKQPSATHRSHDIEILFTALYNTVNEWADIASAQQGRCVKSLLIEEWLECLTYMMKEKEASSDNKALTVDEYLSFAWEIVGCKTCTYMVIHFLGIKFSQEMLTSVECVNLLKHVSMVARIQNDIRTLKREEEEEGKINSVSLQAAECGGANPVEEAIAKLRQRIEYHRRKVVQLIVQTKENLVPKEYKNLLWRTGEAGYYIYSDLDGFASQQNVINDMKAFIYDPLNLP
ncbi:beta-phellandrene synthase (neryl-diphosphate-cyclizing), chloroplastic-like [Sesamum indicum]|uniref:Beta-phellandrene synthase (Neryl-diphosphate-cyclizing), chloroplastic-like n=1 Tax=Sesamum indicum TaxID=4182 RepID=A0A6I9T3B0_SESIN|nr:beta-phellandrene synthase (neryl-diphosphate-cyclizing), chloroplastic-like [Sesamum indicum]